MPNSKHLYSCFLLKTSSLTMLYAESYIPASLEATEPSIAEYWHLFPSIKKWPKLPCFLPYNLLRYGYASFCTLYPIKK